MTAPRSAGRDLTVSGLSKSYVTAAGTRVEALADIDLYIKARSFVSILGPSGCGKSTLLKIMAGLVDYEVGEVKRGDDLVRGPGSDVGVVFQAPELVPWRSTLGNVLLAAELAGLRSRPLRTKARDLLELVGLGQFVDRPPQELSGGMQQRNAIARALLLDPAILLMDEPFGALDALTRDRMSIELQRIWAATGCTIAFVTHSIPEAILLSDQIVVMSPRPGRVLTIIDVPLARPRGESALASAEATAIATQIRDLLGRAGDPTDQATVGASNG